MKIVEKDGSIIFTVSVVPRSSKSEIVGEHNGTLKVRIASPPVDGAANAELIKLLAKQFAISKSDIDIISGHISKKKHVRIRGSKPTDLDAVLKAKT